MHERRRRVRTHPSALDDAALRTGRPVMATFKVAMGRQTEALRATRTARLMIEKGIEQIDYSEATL